MPTINHSQPTFLKQRYGGGTLSVPFAKNNMAMENFIICICLISITVPFAVIKHDIVSPFSSRTFQPCLMTEGWQSRKNHHSFTILMGGNYHPQMLCLLKHLVDNQIQCFDPQLQVAIFFFKQKKTLTIAISQISIHKNEQI